MTSNFERFGFSAAKIRNRLNLLDLSDADYNLSGRLQKEVLLPHFSSIMNQFMAKMLTWPEVRLILHSDDDKRRVKKTITQFLLSLGMGYDSQGYFEHRLTVGLAHESVGLSLSLYLCAYRCLTQCIIDNIPDQIRHDRDFYDRLVEFLYKINALDMSLAIETYHGSHVESLEESIESLQAKQEDLRKQAITDSLTGMVNHEQVFSELARVLTAAQRERIPLCILMADLDYFKKVNDTYGHQSGDMVLRETSERIKSSLRDFDLVGRYGGEEFMILLVNTTLDTAGLIAERIRIAIEREPMPTTSQPINVTVSMGIAAAGEADTVETLVERADSALYNAKRGGRNQVAVL